MKKQSICSSKEVDYFILDSTQENYDASEGSINPYFLFKKDGTLVAVNDVPLNGKWDKDTIIFHYENENGENDDVVLHYTVEDDLLKLIDDERPGEIELYRRSNDEPPARPEGDITVEVKVTDNANTGRMSAYCPKGWYYHPQTNESIRLSLSPNPHSDVGTITITRSGSENTEYTIKGEEMMNTFGDKDWYFILDSENNIAELKTLIEDSIITVKGFPAEELIDQILPSIQFAWNTQQNKNPHICNGKETDYFVLEYMNDNAGNSVTPEMLKDLGLEFYLQFNNDGTIEAMQVVPMNGTWNDNTFTLATKDSNNEKPINYHFTIDGDLLTVEQESDTGEKYFYRRCAEKPNIEGIETIFDKIIKETDKEIDTAANEFATSVGAIMDSTETEIEKMKNGITTAIDDMVRNIENTDASGYADPDAQSGEKIVEIKVTDGFVTGQMSVYCPKEWYYHPQDHISGRIIMNKSESKFAFASNVAITHCIRELADFNFKDAKKKKFGDKTWETALDKENQAIEMITYLDDSIITVKAFPPETIPENELKQIVSSIQLTWDTQQSNLAICEEKEEDYFKIRSLAESGFVFDREHISDHWWICFKKDGTLTAQLHTSIADAIDADTDEPLTGTWINNTITFANANKTIDIPFTLEGDIITIDLKDTCTMTFRRSDDTSAPPDKSGICSTKDEDHFILMSSPNTEGANMLFKKDGTVILLHNRLMTGTWDENTITFFVKNAEGKDQKVVFNYSIMGNMLNFAPEGDNDTAELYRRSGPFDDDLPTIPKSDTTIEVKVSDGFNIGYMSAYCPEKWYYHPQEEDKKETIYFSRSPVAKNDFMPSITISCSKRENAGFTIEGEEMSNTFGDREWYFIFDEENEIIELITLIDDSAITIKGYPSNEVIEQILPSIQLTWDAQQNNDAVFKDKEEARFKLHSGVSFDGNTQNYTAGDYWIDFRKDGTVTLKLYDMLIFAIIFDSDAGDTITGTWKNDTITFPYGDSPTDIPFTIEDDTVTLNLNNVTRLIFRRCEK